MYLFGSSIRALFRFFGSSSRFSLSVTTTRTGIFATRLSRPLSNKDLESKGQEGTIYDGGCVGSGDVYSNNRDPA